MIKCTNSTPPFSSANSTLHVDSLDEFHPSCLSLSISRRFSPSLLLAANVVPLILLIPVKETTQEEKQLTSVFVGVIVLLKMRGEISKQQQQNSCRKLALNRKELTLGGGQRQTDLKMSRQATQFQCCFFW